MPTARCRRFRLLLMLASAIVFIPSRAVAQTGSIAGSVVGGGVPRGGVEVTIYDAAEQRTATAFTSPTGAFAVSGLSPGTYYAYAYAGNVSGVYADMVYPSMPCIGPPATGSGTYCRVNSGGQILVASGTTTSGVDFVLQPGGTVTGTVTAQGVAYGDTSVELHVANGATSTPRFATVTQPSGTYSFGRLPPGVYYVWAGNIGGGDQGGYVAELGDDVPCPKALWDGIPVSGSGCSLSLSTGVALSGSSPVAVNLDLPRGGAISGSVLGNGRPVLNYAPSVEVYTPSGRRVAQANGGTHVSGDYAVRGLPPGQYYVTAQVPLVYQSEVFDDVSCPQGDCLAVLTGGALVTVSVGHVTSAINFDLAPGSPMVTAHPFGQGVLAGATMTLSVTATGAAPLSYQWYAGTAGDTSSPIAGATGQEFVTPPVLATASYWARVSNARGFADTVTVTLTVAPSGTGSITGTVHSGGQPLNNALVWIYDGSGQIRVGARTTASGAFQTHFLYPGLYYVFFKPDSSLSDLPGLLYPNVSCAGVPQTVGSYCRLDTGAPVLVSADATTTGIHLDVSPGGAIAGRVTAQGGVPQSGVVSLIVDAAATSRIAASTQPDALGFYAIRGLPPGPYRVSATARGMTEEAWNDVPCPALGCLSGGGVPVDVLAGLVTSGIDYDLAPLMPLVATQPRSQIIEPGQAAVLTVTASGQPQLSYQWYRGRSGSTANPIAGATANVYDTGSLSASAEYWVRVTNTHGSTDSATATVALAPGAYGGLVGGSGGTITGGTIGQPVSLPLPRRQGGRSVGSAAGASAPAGGASPTRSIKRKRSGGGA